MSVEQVALQVVDTLNGAGIPYALVGSFASNRWGIPRATKDADFVLQLASQGDRHGTQPRLEDLQRSIPPT